MEINQTQPQEEVNNELTPVNKKPGKIILIAGIVIFTIFLLIGAGWLLFLSTNQEHTTVGADIPAEYVEGTDDSKKTELKNPQHSFAVTFLDTANAQDATGIYDMLHPLLRDEISVKFVKDVITLPYVTEAVELEMMSIENIRIGSHPDTGEWTPAIRYTGKIAYKTYPQEGILILESVEEAGDVKITRFNFQRTAIIKTDLGLKKDMEEMQKQVLFNLTYPLHMPKGYEYGEAIALDLQNRGFPDGQAHKVVAFTLRPTEEEGKSIVSKTLLVQQIEYIIEDEELKNLLGQEGNDITDVDLGNGKKAIIIESFLPMLYVSRGDSLLVLTGDTFLTTDSLVDVAKSMTNI